MGPEEVEPVDGEPENDPAPPVHSDAVTEPEEYGADE